MAVFPIVMSISGYVPQSPVTLQQALITGVAATNPGYTAFLPGTLIEDISSTDVYALLQCDSAIAEIIGSITPYGANAFLLNELGNIFGVDPQSPTNTSVYVQIYGPPGFAIAQGFIVADSNYQYILQEAGAIGAGGVSGDLLAISPTAGAWAVPAGSVTEIITEPPTGINLTVNNDADGIPATLPETIQDYRARVLQAGYAPGQGMTTYLKTLLQNLPGVVKRLVSVRQVSANPYSWEVICGGGDQYLVANAIWRAGLMLTSLSGSVMSVDNITNANPGVVTTVLKHGFSSGQFITMTGVQGMTQVNYVPYEINVIDLYNFSLNADTTSFAPYLDGGIIQPNLRNRTVPVYDYPDTYSVTYVNPPQQLVAISVMWNTIATNFISSVTISQLAIPAIVDYINSIIVGQPINILELNAAFQAAVAGVIPPQLLTRLVWTINVDNVGVTPLPGTQEIPGDPESFFFTSEALIAVNQG